MSAATSGHAALDPERIEIEELEALPDDEARARFCRSGVDFLSRQLDALTRQADAIEVKRNEVQAMWDGKADEAVAMRDAMRNELARWESRLAELED